jgi:hypothetical protein
MRALDRYAMFLLLAFLALYIMELLGFKSILDGPVFHGVPDGTYSIKPHRF